MPLFIHRRRTRLATDFVAKFWYLFHVGPLKALIDIPGTRDYHLPRELRNKFRERKFSYMRFTYNPNLLHKKSRSSERLPCLKICLSTYYISFSVDPLNKEAILRMLLSSYPNRPNVSPPFGVTIATVEVAGCECHFSIVMSDNTQIVGMIYIENCVSCLNFRQVASPYDLN